MYNKTLFILIIIILIITIIYFLYNNYKLRIKENYENYSDYSKKYILDDCIQGWGKDYKQKNPSITQSVNDLCLLNAYVKESRYLCGICGTSDNSPLYAVNSPLNNNTLYYGCKKDTTNLIQLNWNQGGNILPANISDMRTCNTQNINIDNINFK